MSRCTFGARASRFKKMNGTPNQTLEPMTRSAGQRLVPVVNPRRRSPPWLSFFVSRAVNSDPTALKRLLHRRSLADLLLVACAVFAFSWIPSAIVLIYGDSEARPVFRVLWQLWPMAA